MNKIIAIGLASILSFFLFAFMNLLIDGEARVIPSEPSTVIDLTLNISDLKPEIKDRSVRPEKPEFKELAPKPEISNARVQRTSDKPLRLAVNRPAFDIAGSTQVSFSTEDFVEKSTFGSGMGSKSPTVRIEPHYPSKAARDNIEGFVTLSFDINELGETTNIRVVESNPKGYFEKASRKAVRKWKYKSEQEGESVAATDQVVTLTFNLHGEI